MWLMLQKPESSDYVVATGVGATVRDFARVSFAHAGLDWEKFVEIDEKYERPTEVDALIGDPSKAKRELGWSATTHWKALAQLMVDADLKKL
jgi:GDPmannose 4,6-dehydratase